MVFQGKVQRFCHRIQGMLRLPRQKEPCNAHGVQVCKLSLYPQSPGIFFDKTHVKAGIVGGKHRIAAKGKKCRQHRFDAVRIHHHTVMDAGELFYSERYRFFRVHKNRKPIHDLSLFYLHCPDLYDPVIYRGKSGGFKIKDNDLIRQELTFIMAHNSV